MTESGPEVRADEGDSLARRERTLDAIRRWTRRSILLQIGGAFFIIAGGRVGAAMQELTGAACWMTGVAFGAVSTAIACRHYRWLPTKFLNAAFFPWLLALVLFVAVMILY